MQHPLIQHIDKITSKKTEEGDGILTFFQPVTIAKKQNLQEAGQLTTSMFFVVKGCLRMFFINEKGVEQTIQFALENWWLADFLAFPAQRASEFYIQAVEPSEVLSISFQAQEQLLEQFPQMERYFRLIYQRGYGASQVRMKHQYDFSREELYHYFASRFPEFIQRIPQYLLASYLGFTPEYLSELRKKRS